MKVSITPPCPRCNRRSALWSVHWPKGTYVCTHCDLRKIVPSKRSVVRRHGKWYVIFSATSKRTRTGNSDGEESPFCECRSKIGYTPLRACAVCHNTFAEDTSDGSLCTNGGSHQLRCTRCLRDLSFDDDDPTSVDDSVLSNDTVDAVASERHLLLSLLTRLS